MSRFLNLLVAVALLLPAVALADETEQYNKIRTLLGQSKLDEAEKLFEAALSENPDSTRIKSLRYMMYFYSARAERNDAALGHISAYVDDRLATLEASPSAAGLLQRYVDILLTAMKDNDQEAASFAKLDEIAAKVDKVNEQHEQKDAQLLLASILMRNRQITFLAESGKVKDAGKLLDKRVVEAKKAVAEKPDDTVAKLKLILLGKALSELLADTDPAASAEVRDKYISQLIEAAKQYPESAVLTVAAINNGIATAGSLSRKSPLEAEKLLAQLKEFATSLDSDNAVVKSSLASLERSTASIERSIEAGKVHFALLGKDAFPLDVDAWANGSPLSDDDLKGKVVLLDFWAVWCGPCIATFPHLREWNEKYGDKGLVIIGATRYYTYGWNEETSRPERIAEISPEDERKAMEQFAAHHKLSHRFMVVPKESKFQSNYGVTGIPQAVVIDQQGKIRLIRVGSGEANAHDIGNLLAELLDKESAVGE